MQLDRLYWESPDSRAGPILGYSPAMNYGSELWSYNELWSSDELCGLTTSKPYHEAQMVFQNFQQQSVATSLGTLLSDSFHITLSLTVISNPYKN